MVKFRGKTPTTQDSSDSRIRLLLWALAGVTLLGIIYFLTRGENGAARGGVEADVRNQILIAFPLVAAGIERLLELAFTWYESSNLAFGKPPKTGNLSDEWPVVEVRAARRSMDEAARTLADLDPAAPGYEKAWAAFQTAAQHLYAAHAHVEQSLKNPQYVYRKKLVSLVASLALGVLIGFAFDLRLFAALGFLPEGRLYVLDEFLTGMLLGAGAGPVHGIIEALIALRGIVGIGAPRRPAPATHPAPQPEEDESRAPSAEGAGDFAAELPLGGFEEGGETDDLAVLAAAEMSRAQAEAPPIILSPADEFHVEEFEAERISPWLTLASLTGAGASTPSPFGNGVIGMENTDEAFRDKVVALCGRLGMQPLYLMAVMSFETGGTFSPSIRNPLSGATGLIQFVPATAQALGTTTAALAGMTAVDQLEYVERYFRPYAGRLRTLEDTYMAVLWPAAVGRGPNAVLFRQGTRAYLQNSGLDLNRDGLVTVAEAAEKVRRRILLPS